jgi:hypothetical protein
MTGATPPPSCRGTGCAARWIRAKSAALRHAASRWRRRPAGRRAAGGCNSRPHASASARAGLVSMPQGRPNGAERCPCAMIGDVGDDGRGRRPPPAPGPTSVSSHGVGVDGDGVGHAHHLRDGGFRHHGRMHALLDAGGRALRDAEQLDAVAEFVGRLEIGERDLLDALDRDRRHRPRAEGERGRIASLCAVSKPPMSKVGSASA